MGPSTIDLVRLHAQVSPVAELVDRRRATYRAAASLAAGDGAAGDLAPEVVDNPMVRGHLGEVISGTADLDPAALYSVDAMVTPAGAVPVAGRRVRIASAAAAPSSLSPAVARIGAELSRHGEPGLDTTVLTGATPGWPSAAAALRDGLAMAHRVAPALVADLLPHVALFALLDRARAGRLGSASAREYPGLIVVPTPDRPVEAAEAFVHEAAHQKLFDLAIVGSIFADDYRYAPSFTPPWADGQSAPWPFEQVVAACHAYACLAAFWSVAAGAAGDLHPFSLMPAAADRKAILADWLVDRARFLGRDGRLLVGGLAGAEIPVEPLASPPRPEPSANGARVAVEVRRCGSWKLVMRWTRPAEITWQRA